MAYPNKTPPAGFRLAPSLAETWPIVSAEGKTYTFTIRKDARFSTGAPVTARAFTHALERILTPAMNSGSANGSLLDIVGAHKMLAGKATTLPGAVAKGRSLTLRLTRRVPDLLDRLAGVCAVPPTLSVDPEGAKACLPSPAPYYVSQYAPNERLVLERNRFYRGERPHHVDRITADLTVDREQAVDLVASGAYDTVVGPFQDRAAELRERYGVNKSQFFVEPGVAGVRLFVLNVSRPLFRNNVRLRQAVNFAVDRRALVREVGPAAETPSDQYLLPGVPGYRNVRIYPLKGPDLRTARRLAKNHLRSGKAVLYTNTSIADVAMAQVLRDNLKAIGLDVEIKQLPNLFEKLATPGEGFDIGRFRWFGARDPASLNFMFDGRTIGQPGFGNWSYFDSLKYNGLLDRASRLTGEARYEAYSELDVQLARDAAPAIPVSVVNGLAFVSARVGCVVVNPFIDLTAVCLK